MWKVTQGKKICEVHKSLSLQNFILNPVHFCLLANQQYIVESQNFSPGMQERCYQAKERATPVNLEFPYIECDMCPSIVNLLGV